MFMVRIQRLMARAVAVLGSVVAVVVGIALIAGFFALRSCGLRAAHQYNLDERLWSAAGSGDSALTRRLLRSGANSHYSADGNFTVLRGAISSGNEATIDVVLAGGVSIDEIGSGGMTPLQYFATSGDLECMKRILARQPKLDARSLNGKTALQYALEAKQLAAADLLRRAGARQ